MVCLTTVAVTQYNFMKGQNSFFTGKGYDIHCIAADDGYLHKLEQRDGVAVHELGMTRSVSVLRDMLLFFRLVLLLMRIRPDILHMSTPKAALLGSVAGWLCRVPVRVFLMRGALGIGKVGLKGFILRWSERLTALFSHKVICVSPSLLSYATDNKLFSVKKGCVIGHGMSNGVDIDDLQPEGEFPARLQEFCKGGGVVIGFVGRLVRDKGMEQLQEAWAVLREKYPDLKLLLCGEWEGVINHCAKVGIAADRRVMITGWLEKEQIGHYYRAMDILAFPSFREGFPNVPMEAAAFSLPVVTTDAVGCSDAVVDGVTGVIIPVGDAVALERALSDYIENRAMAQAHGAAGYKRVRELFNPQVIYQGLYGLYTQLLEKKTGLSDGGE